jgi:hypothetical protein
MIDEIKRFLGQCHKWTPAGMKACEYLTTLVERFEKQKETITDYQKETKILKEILKRINDYVKNCQYIVGFGESLDLDDMFSQLRQLIQGQFPVCVVEEEWREYVTPLGTYRIEKPVQIDIGPDSVAVLDAEGIIHIVYDFTAVRIKPCVS